MPAIDKQVFLREYTEALREGSAAMFVGAGISRAAGYVDWKQLLKEVAADLDLDVDRESDLVALAQYHFNDRGARDRLNQLLINEFLEDVELTPSHHLIASLPIHTVWTTNYDDLLEKAFEIAGKRIDVKRRSTDFSTTRRRADATIYKMHGDKTDPAEAILTKEDYETYNPKRELFTIALKGDLTMKTFLFAGVSFADPNLLYLLNRVKQLVNKNGRQHFCLIKKPKSTDYDGAEYDCKRFPHWLSDLRRYNIQPVLIDTYDEVPAILQELNRRSHLRDVFISGSAADFAPLGETRFRELCRQLGKVLIKNEFNVISGFGLGVGDDVIVGAMQSLQRNDDERLQLWPFPQEVPAGIDRAAFWKRYRERMISDAGVCIVLSGNKHDSGNFIPANGVLQEVEITQAQDKVVLPIGATGYIARQLWSVARADSKAYYGIDVSKQLDVLGDESATVESLVQAVIEILKLLNK
jgi:hypothetical protein